MAVHRYVRAAVRVLAACALLALALWWVGPERLRAQWTRIDRTWFLLAVFCAGLAQVVSVLRWRTIARIFGLQAPVRALAVAYAQGMTLNVLLPGATLSGDALRSVRLQAQGNPLPESALTVLLDRLSGLWVLCVLSCLCGLGLALAGRAAPPAPVGPLPPGVLADLQALYVLGLALLSAIPWLPLRPRPAQGAASHGAAGVLARAWNGLCRLHDLAQAQRAALGRSLWSSVLVQALSALTFWLCACAAASGAGGAAAFWQVQAVAAPVFIAGALPISYGGFGARELVAMAAFPLVGLPAALGLEASLLYGLVAVVLGLASAPAFVVKVGAPAAPS